MSNAYWLETYGCQMNKAESNYLEEELHQRGWVQSDTIDNAKLIILNTCAVRESAETRIWGRIGQITPIKKKHNAKLVVMGCMTERLQEEFREKAPQVDILMGTFGKKDFVKFIEEHDKGNLFSVEDYEFSQVYSQKDSSQALVPIMHGCNNFCSYCIVPYVRGREVSRNPEHILEELHSLDKKGTVEVTLLGQNVNSYSYDEKEVVAFADLMKKIDEQNFENIRWIRFLTSHPTDLTEEIIDVLAESKLICHHIHLPVQHGSNAILKRMNRQYTKEEYLELVQKVKNKIPDVALSTDILIGFPGETEEDLEDTLDLMRQVRFEEAFTYFYNPREGTKAFDFPDQLCLEEKKERLQMVIDLQRQISQSEREKSIGITEWALIERRPKKNPSSFLARTERNRMVILPEGDKKVGQFYKVRLNSLKGLTFQGEEVE